MGTESFLGWSESVSILSFLFLLYPKDKASSVFLAGARLAFAIVLFGWFLNLAVMLANDFKMPLIKGGDKVAELVVRQENECLYSGKNFYFPYSYSTSFAKKHVNLWFLADWVRIEQRVDLTFLPRPVRFVLRGVLCVPEGVVFASPGDIIMWGGVTLFLLSIFLLGLRRGVLCARSRRE